MKLVIAEKPSVAISLAAVLGATKKQDGYTEGGGYLVSWCVGHLVELAQPEAYGEQYAKWRREDLPIMPEVWKYEVAKEKQKQLSLLKKLMADKRVESIVCATDAGREGELIFRLVYSYCGCKKPIERLWISSMEDTAIREGFARLRSGSEYDLLYRAAVCRAGADWLVGINGTRLFTVSYHTKLNVGRVMTPTLALVVQREAEISAFQSEPFYVPELHSGSLTASGMKKEDKAEAERIISDCTGKAAAVNSVDRQEKTVQPPRLYDLTILEPSCGVGNFIGMLPDSMAESKAYGVEIDSISGRIAQQLYQNSSIAVNGFEKVQMPDSFFDVAIGNVPFGDFKVRDRKYDKNHWLIHDYFFGKTLDKVRPGGVIAFITSKGTMDKENSAARKYLAQRADLIGAIRLPDNAFKANAGTEVTSDIIFLQKRDRMTDIEPDWVHLDTDENGIRMNAYFVQHPEMVLGDMVLESTRFGMDSTCRAYENADLSDLLSEAVQNLHAQITEYEVEELDEEDLSIPADPAVRNFSYCLVDGKVYYRENSRMYPAALSVTAENRIRGMIAIRECVRRLIEYQTENYPDEDIRREQAELNRLYDDYTKKYGLLSSRGNSLAFGEDSSYCLLCSLEVLDEEGNLKRKADMFTKRTIRPHEAVTSVDTASEALAVSISEKARVDMAYMTELSGKSEDELEADLSGVIFRDIQCAEEAAAVPKAFVDLNRFSFVPADEYLSGNVRRKLRMAKALYEVLPAEKKPLIARNNVRKGTIKTASRSIKSVERTASAATKTTQAASAAQKSALAAAKTSKRTAHAAQTAAKRTAEATKAAAKGTVSAVKGIIAGTKALISALLAGGWISVMIILIVVLLGCAVSLFGGGSSNSYTPISAEVEAYEPLIRQYASQYGIPEYVELIKAVMMQESGGRGLDPMQAAEGSFNTRYPHEPNGIQDPEYSIQCGVQELKAALISAKVETPVDMERIKLALQGYNFGNGYISWAVSNYGGYSYANAVEFSARQAERLGWSSYGDTQYPNHVLRYYPYGRAFTAGGNQIIVEVALTQLGNEGGAPYWSWYGFDSRVEWCACFVSWCADQCGYIESGVIPKFSTCVDGVSWFRSSGQWQDRNYEPQAGDIIFFDWDGDGTSDHVGIVEKCENSVVYTVEGNSGDACRGRQYSVGSSSILGYGVPIY